MRGADVIAMGRARAGLSQQELAGRLGLSQAQLSRVEAGRREPSFALVQRAVAACDLQATVRLTQADDSLHELIVEQLARGPVERLDALVDLEERPGAARALAQAAALPAVLIGAVAVVLRGGVGVPPAGTVELVVESLPRARVLLERARWVQGPHEDRYAGLHARERWLAPHLSVWDLVLVEQPAGTQGFPDLARHAGPLDGVAVPVASVRDLLRIAQASPWQDDRARAPELDALLESEQQVLGVVSA